MFQKNSNVNERWFLENSIEKGKVAVIDIGSNSLRFVIFDRYGRYPYPLFNERITCRLGEGVQKTKKLKKERIQQSLETIKRFSKIIEKAELETVLAIGTAALRLAENAKDFGSSILSHALGIKTEPLSYS